MLMLGFAAIVAALAPPQQAGTGGVRFIDGPTEQWSFGGALYIGVGLGGFYGPFTSGYADDCGSDEARCVTTEFVTIALPRRCGYWKEHRALTVSSRRWLLDVVRRFRHLGRVVNGPEPATTYDLVVDDAQPGLVIGHTDEGVRFLMLYVHGSEVRLKGLRTARSAKALQRAFDGLASNWLKLAPGPAMYPCERAGAVR